MTLPFCSTALQSDTHPYVVVAWVYTELIPVPSTAYRQCAIYGVSLVMFARNEYMSVYLHSEVGT